MYLAITPERPADPRLTQALHGETRKWMEGLGPSSPAHPPLPASWLALRAAPGRTQFTHMDRGPGGFGTVFGTSVELYQDGAVFVACEPQPVFEGEAGAGVPVGISLETVIDELIFAAEVAWPWVVHRSGTWGAATARFGLVGRHSDTVIRLPVNMTARPPEHLTKVSSGDPHGEISVELAQTLSCQGRMAVTHAIATGLLQWFGLAENPLMNEAGEMVPAQWITDSRPSLQKWATDRGIGLADPPGPPAGSFLAPRLQG